MKTKLFIIASLLLLANFANGYDITGVVTGEGMPLPGVVITRIGFTGTDSDATYSVTDMEGRYSIDSGTGDYIMIVASFASYISEIKRVEGDIVNFDLKETPYIPVKFFSSLLDQSGLLSFIIGQQLKGIGVSEIEDFKIYLSDDTLVFSMITTNNNTSSELSIKNFAETTIKGYLNQLQAEGELENFLSQMKSSGMKWGFGIYSKSLNKWDQYSVYDINKIKKLL